ncbi:MAG: hypothetical protein CVU56_15355 [Deltaproteobacteria bacterium HGW-Deltaproteobacteria-14]|nr:MAG: hypothetical protein CVU56_15355 [Deltaproteobacteria bacterium HGW-Deltaproteobacteria-14]
MFFAAVGLALPPAPAHATPKPLPFSYFADVKAAGDFEIETITDFSPVRVARETDDGSDAVTALRFDVTTELELGIGHGLELGWYFAFSQAASAGGHALAFDGMKQRLRWALAEPGEWPIDVGLYFEIAEKPDELELEEKLLLSKRVGAVRMLVNVWFEQEYYFQENAWKLIYHPTAGVTYDLSPNATVGLEYWAQGHLEAGGRSAVHYLGPTLMLSSANPWLSIGVYLRLDHLGDAAAVGDPFGKLWFRTILSFDI